MTGGRRATDKVSYDRAIELLASLAMEKALENGDQDVIDEVETCILKLRERGLSSTGTFKRFDPNDPTLPAMLRRQAD